MNNNLLFSVVIISVMAWSCSQKVEGIQPDYTMGEHRITVDGHLLDWDSVEAIEVKTAKNLWLGETLPEGNWKGVDDLSFTWKACHSEGKLYFLIEVSDDSISAFDEKYAWENDCVEIHLDHQGIKGDRIVGIDESNSLEDRYGKRLRGHEMQFLASDPVRVFFDDSKKAYFTDSTQTESFVNRWMGEVVAKKNKAGYSIEIGFAIPNYYATSGDKMGIDIAVCDNDGQGRKTLMTSTGYQGPFWITMDNFHEVRLD